jgi:hypothetical protein
MVASLPHTQQLLPSLPLPFYPSNMAAVKLEAGVVVLSRNILHKLNKFIYWHEFMMNNICNKFNLSPIC